MAKSGRLVLAVVGFLSLAIGRVRPGFPPLGDQYRGRQTRGQPVESTGADHVHGPLGARCAGLLERDLANTPGVAAAMEANYVPVKLNADSPQATVAQFKITGLPTTVIIAPTPQGEIWTRSAAGLPWPEYLAKLNQVAVDVRRRNSAESAQIPSRPAGALAARPVAHADAIAPPPARVAPSPSVMGMQVAGLTASPGAGLPPQSAAGPPAMPSDSVAAGYASVSGPPLTPVARRQTCSCGAGSRLQRHQFGRSRPCRRRPLSHVRPRWFLPGAIGGESGVEPAATAAGARASRPHVPVRRPDEQRRFLADPDRYAPVNSGEDVVVALEEGRRCRACGRTASSSAATSICSPTRITLEQFSKNPKYYAERALVAMRGPVRRSAGAVRLEAGGWRLQGKKNKPLAASQCLPVEQGIAKPQAAETASPPASSLQPSASSLQPPPINFASRVTCARTPSRVGIQPQCAAETLQGRNGVAQFQIRPAHAHRGDEMIGIDLQRLVAIADRFAEVAQGVMRVGPLVPGLGEGGGALDQLARPGGCTFSNCRAAFRRMMAPSRLRSASSPARVHTWRMLFSARIRTVRSLSCKAEPSTALFS